VNDIPKKFLDKLKAKTVIGFNHNVDSNLHEIAQKTAKIIANTQMSLSHHKELKFSHLNRYRRY